MYLYVSWDAFLQGDMLENANHRGEKKLNEKIISYYNGFCLPSQTNGISSNSFVHL